MSKSFEKFCFTLTSFPGPKGAKGESGLEFVHDFFKERFGLLMVHLPLMFFITHCNIKNKIIHVFKKRFGLVRY